MGDLGIDALGSVSGAGVFSGLAITSNAPCRVRSRWTGRRDCVGRRSIAGHQARHAKSAGLVRANAQKLMSPRLVRAGNDKAVGRGGRSAPNVGPATVLQRRRPAISILLPSRESRLVPL
jgi:hypothetical protein